MLRFKLAMRRDIGEEAGPDVFHGRSWRTASNEARRPTLFEITWPASSRRENPRVSALGRSNMWMLR
jgi:hypothetical protein